MVIVVDCETLLTAQGQPQPGAIEAMISVAEEEGDQLVYLSSSSDVDALMIQMHRLGFPKAEHVVSCQNNGEKLAAIFAAPFAPATQVTLVAPVTVLKALDLKILLDEHPRAARWLKARFLFLIYGIEWVTLDLSPFIAFPVAVQLNWQLPPIL